MNKLIRGLALAFCLGSCAENPTKAPDPVSDMDAARFAASSSLAVRAKLAGKPYTYVVRHGGEEVFRVEALKWRNGHKGAVSITYDAPWGIASVFSLATDAVIARGLRMDL